MSDNPYAAPQFPGDLPPGAGGPIGPAAPWEPTEVLGIAWAIFKQHWVVLFFAHLLSFIFQMVPSFIGGMVEGAMEIAPQSVEHYAIQLVANVASSIIQAFFSVGLIRIALQAARGETPDFGKLFGGFDRFLPILAIAFITGIPKTIGFLLLIVPGVILACGWMFSEWLVVDRDTPAMQAIGDSWRLTDGHKMNLFVFGLLSILIFVVGCFACYFGIAAAQAIATVGAAIIYLRLTGQQRGAPPMFGT
ncbi:MAG: hypothetical protein AB7K71_04075 [Polyangiaceae bacterium]